jgi:chromate transport protein ChrA
MPCAAALLVIVLRDAYASEPSRPLLARAFDVVPAVAVGLVLEATLAIVGSTLALPRFITIAAAALSMFTLSTARLTFPPPRHGMPPGSTPA